MMLAPFAAVLVFLVLARSAWATLAVYHAQILLWSRGEIPRVFRGPDARLALAACLPSLLAGPVTWALLPSITLTPVREWLAAYGLQGASLMAFAPYYGLVHPVLEQAHWSRLRAGSAGWLAHAAFASYHVIVLATLMKTPWVAACAAVLVCASVSWAWIERRSGGLLVPYAAQAVADSGMILAAAIRASG